MAKLSKFGEVKDFSTNDIKKSMTPMPILSACTNSFPKLPSYHSDLIYSFITATALDPSVKDAYAADIWDPEAYVEGIKYTA